MTTKILSVTFDSLIFSHNHSATITKLIDQALENSNKATLPSTFVLF